MSVIAVVDVGSNSIKVAVISAADRRELGRKSEAVRLQPEGGPSEPFSSEARAEAVATAAPFFRQFALDRHAAFVAETKHRGDLESIFAKAVKEVTP
jgi:exopolyphosphatase/pppGpp-phosphohydrolase